MTQIKETTPFNFDEVYQNIKDKFEAKGYDTEEGSNTAQLITSMAYLTSMLNVNTSLNINEAILPLATRKDNAIQSARAMGYEIQHKQSYKYLVTLSLEAGNHTIPKYSKFTFNDKEYYYFGKQLDFKDVTDGHEVQIQVKEGELFKFSNYPDSLITTIGNTTNDLGEEIIQYKVPIPFLNVEENGIEVYLTYISDSGVLVQNEEWKKSEQVIFDNDISTNKRYFRIDDVEHKTPEIYFKMSTSDKDLRVGTVVKFNILTTSGESGMIDDITDASNLKHDLKNIEVKKIDLFLEGTEEEDISSIKENAPKFFNSANRLVVNYDYQGLCNRQTTVKSSLVWGGDDELPKCPGHIWFSFLPQRYERNFIANDFKTQYELQDADYQWDYNLSTDTEEYDNYKELQNDFLSKRFLEDGEIKSYEYNETGDLIDHGVWDVLENYKIPTIEFHNRHPIYLDFEYNLDILKYNISDSRDDIHENIFNVVDNFFTGENNETVQMEKFDGVYFHSSLEKRIDQVLTDDSGFSNDVKTKLLITSKNVSIENDVRENRDIFIHLAVPLEDYFDDNNFLISTALPSIDTENFIEYFGETGFNLYTDWSDIQKEIEAGETQKYKDIISAPIRISMNETNILEQDATFYEISKFQIVPDLPSQIGADSMTFEKTIVYINGAAIPYGEDGGWLVDTDDLQKIYFNVLQINEGDEIKIETKASCGNYYLYNSYKKFIIIQLYVNALGYTEDGNLSSYDMHSPKSYLTSDDGFYFYTENDFYLTTEGFAVKDENELNTYTGSILRKISDNDYKYSPINMDLFRRPRYLDFKYSSPNFTVSKNILPRLRKVTFNV